MKVKKKLKFTFLIVKRDVSSKVIGYLQDAGFKDCFSFYGQGSASVAILDYLGIGETENNVIIYPSNEEEAGVLMESVRNSEYLKDIIAFRVPVKGISSMNALNYFLREGISNE